MEWVEIKKGIPVEIINVLVCDINGRMLVTKTDDVKKYHGGYCADTELHWFPQVTHWMVLPITPK